MTIIMVFYLVFIVGPFSMIVHELGHAFGAKRVKGKHITIVLGAGKKVFEFYLVKIKIEIKAFYFLGAYTKSRKDPNYTKRDVFWITFFGPLNNLVFTFFLLYLDGIFMNPYMRLMLLFNLWMFVVNLIPFKIKEKRSDGYILFNSVFRNNNKN